MINLPVINKSNNPLPQYQTKQSAGVDLRAFTSEDVMLGPGERVLVGTGLHIALPDGYEAQIRPRSGLAFKHGITIINSPGTIDADYRGEIKIALINHSNEDFCDKKWRQNSSDGYFKIRTNIIFTYAEFGRDRTR